MSAPELTELESIRNAGRLREGAEFTSPNRQVGSAEAGGVCRSSVRVIPGFSQGHLTKAGPNDSTTVTAGIGEFLAGFHLADEVQCRARCNLRDEVRQLVRMFCGRHDDDCDDLVEHDRSTL